MKPVRVGVWLTLGVLCAAGCAKGPAKATPNIQTSLGMLTEVERRVAGDAANPAKNDGFVYRLSFKGKIVIPDYEDGWSLRYPLVDRRGRKYPPILAGTPAADGKISTNRDNWTMDGALTARDGRWVFKGSATVPEGALVLEYVLPRDGVEGLVLKDGETNHPLGLE